MNLKKGDLILIFVLVLFFISTFIISLNKVSNKEKIIIREKGRTIKTININQDQIIQLKNNTIVIENKKIYMKNANCPDQICVKHKPLTQKGSIICLPNRVEVLFDE